MNDCHDGLFSRRNTLKAGAATLGAAAFASLFAAPLLPSSAFAAGMSRPPQRAKRTLRKAVMWYMVGEGSTVLEKFQILKDCGFDGVEMDSPSDIKVEEILEAQAKTGIKVHGLINSVHWKFHLNAPDATVREKATDILASVLRDAKAMGCTSILLVPGVVNAKQGYAECWSLSQECIRKVLPVAKEAGVTIGIENVWNNFIMSPLEAARYVDEFNDPAVAWHFDIGNCINYGFPDQWIRTLGKRLAKLHIKDFSRKKRDEEGLWKGFNVELGEGDANWKAVMLALDEVGYSTSERGEWASAEVSGGDHKHLIKVREQMDALFAM